MARWCPTATAPAITRSQTTSSSACLVFGRTLERARPCSSKSWARACSKSGTCAIQAILPLLLPPSWLRAAQEPASSIDQGSKPYASGWVGAPPTQLLHVTLLDFSVRISSWEAFVCCFHACNSDSLKSKCKALIYELYIYSKKMWMKTVNHFFFWVSVDIRMTRGPETTPLDSVDRAEEVCCL